MKDKTLLYPIFQPFHTPYAKLKSVSTSIFFSILKRFIDDD